MRIWEGIKAEDIMSSPVVALNVETNLEEATRTLSENKISGALVTDHRGAAVGVISLFDIATFLSGYVRSEGEPGGFYRYTYPTFAEGGGGETTNWEEVEEESLDQVTVGELMSPDIITVSAHLPLKEVAKVMAERHIHRVFVASEEGPIGVISTMDVLGVLTGVKPPKVRA